MDKQDAIVLLFLILTFLSVGCLHNGPKEMKEKYRQKKDEVKENSIFRKIYPWMVRYCKNNPWNDVFTYYYAVPFTITLCIFLVFLIVSIIYWIWKPVFILTLYTTVPIMPIISILDFIATLIWTGERREH